MSLLTLDAVSNTWNRCVCCGHLIRPIILARVYDAKQSDFYCFRCYHILAAVRVSARPVKGGV